MRGTLIVIGLFVLAMALRSSRKNVIRKLGALAFLITTFVFFYFISGNIFAGIAGASLWFFLPWIELLTHVRRLRMPLNNRLRHRDLPNPSFFPNAIEAAAGMEEAGFDHVSDCSWQWSGMHQHFRLFWHPEQRCAYANRTKSHSLSFRSQLLIFPEKLGAQRTFHSRQLCAVRLTSSGTTSLARNRAFIKFSKITTSFWRGRKLTGTNSRFPIRNFSRKTLKMRCGSKWITI